MINFFKWFYTNQDGVEYMTLKDCSINDSFIIWGGLAQDLIILALYILIASHAYKLAIQYSKSITRSFLIQLMFVFVFCAFCGYGYTALSVFINPYKLRFILKLFLIYFSFRLLDNMKNTRVIERIFQAEKHFIDTLKKAEETTKRFNQEQRGVITIEDLRALPKGIWHYLPNDPGVRFKKTEDSDPLWPTFITEMKKDSSFGLHVHPRIIEDLKIIKGGLRDDINNLILKEGDRHQYLPNVPHKPYCTTDSIYLVRFIDAEASS